MKKIAVLDADRVLRGVETIEDDALTPAQVVVADDCALEPGAWQWNGAAFVPYTPPPAVVHVARIDLMGVYQGVETIAADALTPAHVVVPADCDLAPGRYRWDGASFVPITQPKLGPTLAAGVTAEIALAGVIVALQAVPGVVLPPAVTLWLAAFQQTLDAQG